MSYVQCTEKELEKQMIKLGAGFVSPDHRIYETIEFFDDAATWEVDAKTFLALADLQNHIEMCADGMNEMPFQDVEDRAKDLREAFDRALAAVKFKPLKRK